jgi:methylenetetrahydrofolate reductase (NADPH)
MKVIDIINNAKSTLFTFELLPPLKEGNSFAEIAETMDRLISYNPAYINITHHRAEVILKERQDGLLEKHIIKKHASTTSVAAAIKYKYNVEVVPHLVCGGFNRNEIEDILIDFNFLDINNILVLRGDPVKGEKYFTAEKQGYSNAIELIHQVKNMNEGKYLDADMENVTSTDFCFGVAGYPEKHYESPNMDIDLHYLKEKVDAGAEYVVTQMFFDNKKYFEFVVACRNIGIAVPIIPGLKPFASRKHLTILPQIFHIDLPVDLITEVNNCSNLQDIRHVGIEWCVAQCNELKKAGVPALHFYTMGKADNVEEIVKRVF